MLNKPKDRQEAIDRNILFTQEEKDAIRAKAEAFNKKIRTAKAK